MSKANYLILCLLLGATAVVQTRAGSDHAMLTEKADLSGVPASFDGWHSRELQLNAASQSMLEPDAVLWRVYTDPKGVPLEFLVVYGHQKKTFHSPGFCLPGGGWEIAARRLVELELGAYGPIRANVLELQRDRHRQLAVYWFAHGRATTPSLVRLNAKLLLSRIAHRQAGGALVRLVMPITSTEEQALQRAEAFLKKVYPEVVRRISA